MNDLVSIVVPCFNASPWLEKSIESLLGQSHRHIEIIAINDGSTDETSEILEGFSRRDARLRVIHFEANLGIVAALNCGLDVAQGALIARMDADDICHPRRIEKQIAFINSGSIDLCGSWFVEFGQGPRRKTCWPHETNALKAAMMFQNTVCHPTIVARRTVFERFRYRDEYRLAEDYDLVSRAMKEFRIANVPEVLLRYRRHPSQATQAYRSAMEQVTRPIRIQALAAAGVFPSPVQAKLHHMIRAPASIRDADDLGGIETWLLSLLKADWEPSAKRVIASQWIRACIRAAPLGTGMLGAFRRSPLTKIAGAGTGTKIDVAALALSKLDYLSPPFSLLRRFGLGA